VLATVWARGKCVRSVRHQHARASSYSGDDNLTGTANADTMWGLAGNDTLNGRSRGRPDDRRLGQRHLRRRHAADVVTENANEGTDTGRVRLTLTLGANVENLTLTGATAINRHREYAGQRAHGQQRCEPLSQWSRQRHAERRSRQRHGGRRHRQRHSMWWMSPPTW